MNHHSSVARRDSPSCLLVLRRILAYAGCVAGNPVKYALHRLMYLLTHKDQRSLQTNDHIRSGIDIDLRSSNSRQHQDNRYYLYLIYN